MSGLEVNKILASIILAILVVTVIGHLGDIIVDIDHHEMEETAYKIDVEELPSDGDTTTKKEEIIEPISNSARQKPKWVLQQVFKPL